MPDADPKPFFPEKPREKIRTSKALAEALGYSRDEGEKEGSVFRRYTKPVSVEAGDGTATLVFDDTTWNGPRDEYIGVGIEGKAVSLAELDPEIYERLDLEEGIHASPGNKVFSKRSLKDGGYDRLYDHLRLLEENGYFTGLLQERLDAEQELREQVAKGGKRIHEKMQHVIPEMFPQFTNIDTSQVENGAVYFYTESKARTREVLGISTTRGEAVSAWLGIGKIDKDSGRLDAETVKLSRQIFAPTQAFQEPAKKKKGWDRFNETLDEVPERIDEYLKMRDYAATIGSTQWHEVAWVEAFQAAISLADALDYRDLYVLGMLGREKSAQVRDGARKISGARELIAANREERGA